MTTHGARIAPSAFRTSSSAFISVSRCAIEELAASRT
jgi:hypothetical protein